MRSTELVGTADVPGGVQLQLLRSGDDFVIVLDENELMSSDQTASEVALGRLTCERLHPQVAPQLLIGGYGMGFTLRAALAALGEDASVTVAELVPEIIDWALGPMGALTAGTFDDERVMLVMMDVAVLVGAARDAYHAILLDVDNGPEGLTRSINDRLYTPSGLRAAMRALLPGGILAVWSAWSDPGFTQRLASAGFEVSQVDFHDPHNGDNDPQIIWFARKPDGR